jgi:hypothetical protein
MSSPPPPDQWLPPQPMGGPSQGPPFGPSPWGPQQQPGPPNRGGGLKWVLGAVVLLLVVAVSVGATLLFTRDDTGGDSPTGTASPTSSSGPASDIASANDKGPVQIITEDPTCAPWAPINNTLANRQKNGWTNRDPTVPAVAWSTDIRTIFNEVGIAFDEAADETVPLAKLTPNRVMRELYEQFIAYARAYANSLPTYTEPDNNLANVAVSSSLVLTHICDAANNGSAAARAPLVTQTMQPTAPATAGDPAKPLRFLTSPDPICQEWISAGTQFNNDMTAWAQSDPRIPVDQWSDEQKSLSTAVTPVLTKYADDMQSIAMRSTNPVLQDFAAVSAVYLRAYVQALPTYNPNDRHLYTTAMQSSLIIDAACLGAGN